jgi:PRMT5 arginine-N-methyltransferase/ribosomal protein L11 methyltransferase PrmA
LSRILEEHRLYLNDRHRLSAYARALRELVHAGDVVVDLGSGTGILGMLAVRAGASRVYAIEQDAIAGLGRQIARANGFDGVITTIRGKSRSVMLPERAALAVCDQMGPFGIDANVLDVARHARERFLRPGGRLVPNRLELMIAAVEHPGLHARVTFWRRRRAGFDVSAAAGLAANSPSYLRLHPDRLISTPAAAGAVDLMADVAMPIRVSAELQASRDGMLHGIAGWFEATLSPAVSMTNSPSAAPRIRRSQIFFPLREPVPLARGAGVAASLQILPAADMYSWEVEAGSRCFRHSTLGGMMLSREDLVRTSPEHRPLRSPGADAALTILQLADGRHPLREIERIVFERHRELFGSAPEASAFVADVLARS